MWLWFGIRMGKGTWNILSKASGPCLKRAWWPTWRTFIVWQICHTLYWDTVVIYRVHAGEPLSWVTKKSHVLRKFDFVLRHIYSCLRCMGVACYRLSCSKMKEHSWASGVGLCSQGHQGKEVKAETKPGLLLPAKSQPRAWLLLCTW